MSLYPDSFEIDGVHFIPGKMRGKSSSNRFLLVKKYAHMEFYRGLKAHNFENILEVGLFEGGSLVLFDKLYKPKKLVGVDIREEPIAPLEEYRKDRKHIITHYGLSQDDEKLAGVLQEDFPEGIDLIVDDASHLYELSRATFHLCFPLLKPGGRYIIEDWAWSLMGPQQEPKHPQYAEEALMNLVLELVINVPGRQIKCLSVHDQLVVVEKGDLATGPIDLSDGHKKLRGRSFHIL